MQRLKKLWRDNRGIEGLPIRLVIALVVGVASLAIMTSILGGLPTFETTEVGVEIREDDDTVDSTVEGVTSGSEEVDIHVITDNGEPVQGAQIVITSGTASMESSSYVATADSGSNDNEVEDIKITDHSSSGVSNPDIETDLRADQETGTLKIEVRPPSDGDYQDEQENSEILVTR